MRNITLKALKMADDGGRFTAILWRDTSKDSPDRDGDAIASRDFDLERYRQNPILLWQHDRNAPIGKAENVRLEGDTLKADFTLGRSAKSQEVAGLVMDGIISAVSVGFQRMASGMNELLEVSLVSVPAHPDALIQRAMPATQEEIQMDPENETTEILAAPAKVKAAPPTYNLGRAMAAQAGLDGIDAGYEREVSQELQSKSGKTDFRVPLTALLSTKAQDTSPGAGAELTAVSQRGDLFANVGDAIRPAMVTGRAGARLIVEADESANVPTMTQGLTPVWQAKDADAGDASATFASANVTPKYMGARFTIKRSALQYSSHPDISAILQSDLRRAVAGELDRVALIGDSGVDALQPDGIWSVVTTSPDVGTVSEMLDLMRGPSEYDEANADAVSVITRQAVLDAFAVTPLGTGLNDAAHRLGSGNLLGRSALTSKHLTEDTGKFRTIVGNFAELLIFLFGDSVGIVMNPWGTAYASGGVEGRILIDANVLVRSPGAFATANVQSAGLTPALAKRK